MRHNTPYQKDLRLRWYRLVEAEHRPVGGVCKLFGIPKKTNYGPKKMRWAVERRFGITVSTTIIYRFYRRRGLIRRPQRKLGWHAPLKEPLVITRPGEGVQLDVKYVYPHGKRQY